MPYDEAVLAAVEAGMLSSPRIPSTDAPSTPAVDRAAPPAADHNVPARDSARATLDSEPPASLAAKRSRSATQSATANTVATPAKRTKSSARKKAGEPEKENATGQLAPGAPFLGSKSTTSKKPASTPRVSVPSQQTSNDEKSDEIDSADEDEQQEDRGGPKKGRRWNDPERTAFYEYLLGPDADETFKELQVNPARVQARVSTLGLRFIGVS